MKKLAMKFYIKDLKITLHWSLLLIFLWFAINDSSLLLILLRFLSTLFIIILHEAGHGIAVLKMGYKVNEISFTLLGGRCVFDGDIYRKEDLIISGAGVFFQILLGIVSLGIYLILTNFLNFNGLYIKYLFLGQFVYYNTFIIIINLFPIPGFDGARILDALDNRYSRIDVEKKRVRRFHPKRKISIKPQGKNKKENLKNKRIKKSHARSRDELRNLTSKIMEEIKIEAFKNKGKEKNYR